MLGKLSSQTRPSGFQCRLMLPLSVRITPSTAPTPNPLRSGSAVFGPPD